MKARTRAVALMLVVLLFGAMALGSGSGSSEPKKVGEVGKTDTSDAAAESQSKEEDQSQDKNKDTPSATEAPMKTEYYVGDILTAEGLEIVYVACGEYVSSNQLSQPKDGNKYIFIELFCKNISDTDKSISAFSFDCYADGYAAESFWGGDDDGLNASMSAGRTMSGRVYFEVPKDAVEIEIEYEYNVFREKKVLFIYEGDKNSGYVPTLDTTASADAFSVGDIVQGKGLTIAYLSCEDCVSNNMFITPADGNKYVCCRFEFENTSDSDKLVSSWSFECYADGMACESKYFRDDDLGTATISPGRKAAGTVTFEVPIDATVIEAEFETNYWTSSHIIFTIK